MKSKSQVRRCTGISSGLVPTLQQKLQMQVISGSSRQNEPSRDRVAMAAAAMSLEITGNWKGVTNMKRYLKSLLALGAALLLAATVAVAANAQNAKPGQNGARKRVLRSMIRPGASLRGLDLSQEEKDQVKALLNSHKEAIKAAVTDGIKAKLVMNRALASGASDQDLKAAFDNATNAQWNALQLRSQMIAEIKPILTPDQQVRLQQRLQKVDARIQNLLKKKIG